MKHVGNCKFIRVFHLFINSVEFKFGAIQDFAFYLCKLQRMRELTLRMCNAKLKQEDADTICNIIKRFKFLETLSL